jgi:flagellin
VKGTQNVGERSLPIRIKEDDLMIINHNISALNTYRQLTINNNAGSRSLEKLSSGYRINRAGDDAAGLAISEKMRGQIRGLNMASRNAQDGISLIQTAEGALQETHAILQRMRELAVQASNDTYEAKDRGEIQKEIDQLTEEIDRIANTTEFNTMKLLNGDRANTFEVTGVAFNGGGASKANVGGTGLDITLKTTNALSVGDHTLEITSTRNTRDSFDVAPSGGDVTFSANSAKFAGDGIDVAAAAETATWTLAKNDDGSYSLSNDTGTVVNDTVKVGEEYSNHGLTFTITEDTMATGDTITFDTITGEDATLATEVIGYAAGNAGDNDATFAGDGITIADDAIAGSVEIEFTSSDSSVDGYKVTIKDTEGNAVYQDTATGAYDAHGISFNITAFGGVVAGDKITLDVKDTYTVKASLDGATAVNLTTTYDGTSTDAIADFAGINGIELDSSTALASGTYSFTVEQTTTGTDNSLTFQIGSNSNQSMNLDISDMSATALAVDELSVVDYDNAQAAIDSIEAAIGKVSAERSKLGAIQNRLDHTINNLGTSSENLTAAESRIRDVDMAKEMMEYAKNTILQQAAQAMLAQANQQPQGVLQLLR